MRLSSGALIWATVWARQAAAGVQDAQSFDSILQACPAACAGTPESWTVYSSLERLNSCDQAMLLDFALYNPLDNADTIIKLRTCAAGSANSTLDGLIPLAASSKSSTDFNSSMSSTCLSSTESRSSLDLHISTDQGSSGAADLRKALGHLQEHLTDTTLCENKFLVTYNQKAIVAFYAGSSIDNSRTITPILERLSTVLFRDGDTTVPRTASLQLCGGGRNSDHIFGIAIDTTGDLAAVQRVVRGWSDAECVNSTQATGKLDGVSIFETSVSPAPMPGGFTNTTVNGTLTARGLYARSDCTTTTVVSGDSCSSLATKCGISAADFTKYNPSSTFCSTLAVGQRVCCSSGTLPDITPKPYANGTCATYTVKANDYCALIAASNGITAAQLQTYNDKTTWGWNGCNNLAVGINICLSKGNPPLPAAVSNAVCGPTVPGTIVPSGKKLADLNPCPLKTCCDVWGQCGMTPEYCTIQSGSTGNPGTAPPGKNGCVSNCGTDIVR